MAILNTKYKTYFSEFQAEMTSINSVYEKTLQSIATQFEEYGIPIEERAEFIVNANLTAMQAIINSANQSALAVITEEKNQDLIDAQIAKVNAETLLVNEKIASEIKNNQFGGILDQQKEKLAQEADLIAKQQVKIDSDILLNTAQQAKINSDIVLNTAQIEKLGKEEALLTQQVLTEVQETAIKLLEQDVMDNQILKLIEDTGLVTETILTQTEETAKKVAETAKITRDKQGYDDQMLIEMVKQQSSVASFAVNSNSDSAQNALDNLKCLMTQVVSRVDTITGETECTLATYTPPV